MATKRTKKASPKKAAQVKVNLPNVPNVKGWWASLSQDDQAVILAITAVLGIQASIPLWMIGRKVGAAFVEKASTTIIEKLGL